jgi:hypothetical protein
MTKKGGQQQQLLLNNNNNNNNNTTMSSWKTSPYVKFAVPDSLKSIFHLPMSSWLDHTSGPQPSNTLRGIPWSNVNSSNLNTNTNRVGGTQAKKIGQVPDTEDGRLADLNYLNRAVQNAILVGQKRGILRPDFKAPKPWIAEDMPFMDEKVQGNRRDPLLATFSLAPDDDTLMPPPNELLPIPHVEHLPLTPPTTRSKPIDNMIPGYDPAMCAKIRQRQKARKITLHLSNLRTLLPERWLDSVVIDAYLHVMQEHFPMKRFLYLGSAENDMSLAELAETPGCFDYFTCVLWKDSHWSCIAGNHMRKRIRYLNSQVSPGSRIPDIQTKPFKDLFSEYGVQTYSPSQQQGSTACGLYSTLSVFLMAMMDESLVERITPADAEKFRYSMLLQLLLSYYLIPMNK